MPQFCCNSFVEYTDEKIARYGLFYTACNFCLGRLGQADLTFSETLISFRQLIDSECDDRVKMSEHYDNPTPLSTEWVRLSTETRKCRAEKLKSVNRDVVAAQSHLDDCFRLARECKDRVRSMAERLYRRS